MQRGEQNKWRTEFASKRKKKYNKKQKPQTKRNSKILSPLPPTQRIRQFGYQIQVQVARNLTIVCCRKAENNFKYMKPFLWLDMRIMYVGDWAVYLYLCGQNG